MFSVDLGYGFGNYLFLSKYTEGFSLRALISGFLDVILESDLEAGISGRESSDTMARITGIVV